MDQVAYRIEGGERARFQPEAQSGFDLANLSAGRQM
jgi:hypothetical protein